MRKLVLAVVVAVLSVACWNSAQASESSYIKTLKLSFVEAGQLASTAKDTMYVTGKADTARTAIIDLSDLDWDAVLAQGSVATGFPVAEVKFVVTKANNGAADTLTFNVEKYAGVPQVVSSSCPTCRADSVFQYNPILASSTNSAIGSVAVAYGGASPLNNIFSGVLVAIPNASSASNMWGVRRFRLVIAGDVSGAQKLSGVMGFITYPAKR